MTRIEKEEQISEALAVLQFSAPVQDESVKAVWKIAYTLAQGGRWEDEILQAIKLYCPTYFCDNNF